MSARPANAGAWWAGAVVLCLGIGLVVVSLPPNGPFIGPAPPGFAGLIARGSRVIGMSAGVFTGALVGTLGLWCLWSAWGDGR
ncbi:hypothetical protein [Halosegnis longus]|uniref:hypothetical protein n=1 Tax=Halosegnis longus TaxID=2216012 RepID=UPI00096A7B06|nr:hypothetical protein [Salella cibi]